MATKHLRVLTISSAWTDHDVEQTAGSVLAGLTGNTNYPNPPVDLATLQQAITNFHLGIAAAAQGGVHATADKNKRRHDLTGMVRKLALYVQTNCNDDMSTLTSSGFQAASTVRTLGPLPKPIINMVDNGVTTQLLVTIQKVPKAKSYELRMATVAANGTPGPWTAAGTFTKSRNLPINGLTPGVNYTFQARAIGGTTGYSDWSDPVTHMSL
jgi:hypothetical protein